ncbi:monovalent cation/H(+) antiporter subunit G [Thermus tengchongensis]|uniref:Na+/H+ antiporter subunit G n=1 Tax=Thermus tengchongensis TaxID=1214928 RepID=A0A4Y9FDS1_9DEIN|nr:monovalent cation/H(+) antiporter subunit G [Thermus tengchongensis]TFU27231.1 Na+/H+ antiporter subunit G [Thermus tengchongensis]
MSLLVDLFLLLGSLVFLVAALGLLRFPDFYIRMSAATKAATLGLGLLLLGVALGFGEGLVAFKAVLLLVFLFSTAPIGAHFLGRAAYRSGVPLWERTHVDELKGREYE